MEYKIGNVEVDAVQWNDTNHSFDLVFNLARNFGEEPSAKVINDSNFRSIKLLIKVSGFTVTLDVGDYLVISDESIFTLSEQDFNNMATKVKEPKFKVGDKVYHYNGFNITVLKISESDKDFYLMEDEGTVQYYDDELMTLEEAIEKLKELEE